MVELAAPEIVRVIRNLLDNAIRHTPPGGRVTVHAGLDGATGSAQVSVRDSCGGIPDADLARVFEMAYQGTRRARPASTGAGSVWRSPEAWSRPTRATSRCATGAGLRVHGPAAVGAIALPPNGSLTRAGRIWRWHRKSARPALTM